MRCRILVSVLLVAAGLAAYWPVRYAQFTNFDDNVYVTANPDVVHGLTCRGVVWALTIVHRNNWHP